MLNPNTILRDQIAKALKDELQGITIEEGEYNCESQKLKLVGMKDAKEIVIEKEIPTGFASNLLKNMCTTVIIRRSREKPSLHIIMLKLKNGDTKTIIQKLE